MKSISFRKYNGVTLIEMVFSIVLISLCFTSTMQLYKHVIVWLSYPMIEKQAIYLAKSIIHSINTDPTWIQKNCDLQYKNNLCQKKITDMQSLSHFNEATHHQYTFHLTNNNIVTDKTPLKVWHLEIKHNQGDIFKFSFIQNPIQQLAVREFVQEDLIEI